MKELISVIIPTFKRPERLLRTVKSVLNQSYSNFEILIINDDKEDSDLDKLFHKIGDNRIKLLQNSRSKGANGARNMGILNAQGNYLAFLDDDDEWMTNYLETQLKCLIDADKDVGLVYGGYLLEKNTKWVPNYQNKEGELFSDIILDKLFIGASSNIFIKKEIIEKVGLWDEDLLRQQDLEFLIRVFKYYKGAYNNKLILKVYGHNDPKPEKSFHSREEFVKKIMPHLNSISEMEKALFFSNHYRRQALYLIKMRSYRNARKYWYMAFKNRKVSVKKDGKLIISLFGSF